jgi:hypothetical protein
MTTASGVTFAVPLWVDDTDTPTEFVPINYMLNAAGDAPAPLDTLLENIAALVASGAGAQGAGAEAAAILTTLPTNRLGAVLPLTPVMDTSAYATGDVAFIPIELAGFVHHIGGSAEIRNLWIIDENDQGVAMDIYFQDSNASMGSLNAAFTPSDANARALLGRVQIAAADWQDLGGVRVAMIDNIGQKIKADAATTSIWVSGAIRSGTPTFTASGISMKIGVNWD